MFRIARPHRGVTSAPLRHRVAGVVAVVALSGSVLAGCAAGQISQTADQIAGVDGAQGTVGSVGIANALLATPDGKDYPKGSSAPLVLWVSNDADHPDTLTGISTDAGSVTIKGTATIPPQSIIQIGPSAKVSATVTDVTSTLKYGISVPMTFSFAKAGDLKLNVPIENPPQRTTPRATTDMYPSEVPNLWQTAGPTPSNLTSPASGLPTTQTVTTSGPTTTPGPTTGRVDTTSPSPITSPGPVVTG